MPDTLTKSYKYNDSPTVYGDIGGKTYAFGNEKDFLDVGGNFSTVQNLGQVTPELLKSSPIYSSQSTAPTTQASTFSNFSKPAPGVSNSSLAVDTAVGNLGTNINTAQNNTNLQSLLDLFKSSSESSQEATEKSQKLIDDRQATLDKRREEELARLNAEYDTAKATKEAQYQKDIEPTKRRLELLNSTPYGPNATLEEELKLKLSGLEQTHKLEMDTLFNSRQSYIAQAQALYEDKNFEMAESQLKAAADMEKAMYDRQQDFLNLTLKLQEEERARQKAEFEQAKSAFDFNIKYSINQPYYTLGGTVFNSNTLKPEYENVNGSMVRISDGKVYNNINDFYKDSGISSLSQVQVINQEASAEKDLVADMQKKYIDAGISLNDTYDQALAKVQSKSRIYRQQTRLADGSGDEDGDLPSASKVKNILYKIKQDNAGIAWYDQWGQAAEYLQANGLNPSNYDKEFWEIFHPEGLKGYDTYVKNEGLD